ARSYCWGPGSAVIPLSRSERLPGQQVPAYSSFRWRSSLRKTQSAMKMPPLTMTVKQTMQTTMRTFWSAMTSSPLWAAAACSMRYKVRFSQRGGEPWSEAFTVMKNVPRSARPISLLATISPLNFPMRKARRRRWRRRCCRR
ncbi:hypothetical protein EGW08_003926, partial [Elysia chlorotica]